MANGIYQDIYEDYGTNTICVADFEVAWKGTLVTHLHRDDSGYTQIWAGNSDEDSHAEQLLPTRDERNAIIYECLNYL